MLLKHRLTYEDLATLQSAIDEGFCLRSKDHAMLEFVYYNASQKPYIVVLKCAAFGQELWVVTMHRSNRQQARSKTKRQYVYRDHA